MQDDFEVGFTESGEIDFREVLGALWAGKFKIVLISSLFALGSILYALSVPNQYKASALLAPAQQDSGGLSSALQQLGGLASLAGVNIGSGQSSESKIAQEVMRSWNFQYEFVKSHNLAVELLAVNGWDRQSNELTINTDIYDPDTESWKFKDSKEGPTSWQLFRAFSERVSISEGFKSGLVSVSVEHYSPQRAKQILDMFISDINRFMQMRKVARISNNVGYLQAQIEKTSIAEMQEVFYTIIEEQIKSKMLAEASPEYAFVTVSPAMQPERTSRPNRPVICVLGTLLGAIFAVVVVLVMYFMKK